MKSRASHASVTASYAMHLADAVDACGGSGAQLLAELGRAREELGEPDARLEFSCFVDLVVRAIELTAEPGLGILIGSGAPITRMGMLGYAAMTAETLGETLELLVQFLPLIGTAAALRLSTAGDEATFELVECVPFGPAREVIVFTLFTSFWRVGESLTGVRLPVRVELGFSEPAYYGRLSSRAFSDVATVCFDASGHRLRFAAALLELPLVSADRVAGRTARQACERQLATVVSSDPFLASVHGEMFLSDGQLRAAASVAKRLGMTERTFKRRLSERGTSYSELADARRQARALDLLRAGHSVEDTAAQLGYSDAANFTRAFRRWTGRSPRALLRELGLRRG